METAKDDTDTIGSCINACVVEHTTFLFFLFLENIQNINVLIKEFISFLQNQTMDLAQEEIRSYVAMIIKMTKYRNKTNNGVFACIKFFILVFISNMFEVCVNYWETWCWQLVPASPFSLLHLRVRYCIFIGHWPTPTT